MILTIEDVFPYFTWDTPFTLNIYELRPFCFFLNAPFFQFTVTQVFLMSMMILLCKVTNWNPKIPVVPKKPKLKKSWVAPLYLSTAVHTCKPIIRMCGQDCKPALRHLRMICISFVANWNLLIFARTQRELGALEALRVMCLLQVCGKFTYCAFSVNCLVCSCVSAFIVGCGLCQHLWSNCPGLLCCFILHHINIRSQSVHIPDLYLWIHKWELRTGTNSQSD